MVIAAYEANWQYLSKGHETIDNKLSKMLNDYAANQLEHLAYAVIGTFGVGKTQFLYHIHKRAKDYGMLPLYFIAEDLFREIITNKDKIFTPGDVFSLVKEKVSSIREAIRSNNCDEVRDILDRDCMYTAPDQIQERQTASTEPHNCGLIA